MPTPTPITITALLQNIAGAAATTGAKLRITLCGYNQTQPSVPGVAELAEVYLSIPFSGTTLSFPLYGNDVISPAGTFYCIRTEDAAGNTIAAADYIFTGAGPITLNSAQPMANGYLTQAVPNGAFPGRIYTLPTAVAAAGQDSLLYYNGGIRTDFAVASKRLSLEFETAPGDALFLIYQTGDYGTGPVFTPWLGIANGVTPGRYFTLPTPPAGAQFAGVFYNGALQLPLSSGLPGACYTLTAGAVLFNFDLQPGDEVEVLYYVGPALPAITAVIPAGSYPGTSYTLTTAPVPGLFWLYNLGQFLRPGIDYTLSGTAITLNFATQSGDQLYAYSGS